MRRYSKALVIFCCSFLFIQHAKGVVWITIDFNGYTSTYAWKETYPLDKESAYSSASGIQNILFPSDGTFYINTGATIGDCNNFPTSDIYFQILNNKIVQSSVCPQTAAKFINETEIQLQTATISLYRGDVGVEYRGNLAASFDLQPSTNPVTFGIDQTLNFTLIKGLTYFMYCGGSGYISSSNQLVNPGDALMTGFYFTIDKDGKIVPENTRAITVSKDGATMTLNTTKITVDDAHFKSKNQAYEVMGYGAFNIPTVGGTKDFYVVNSTLNFLVWYDSAGKQHIYYFENF